MKIGIVGLGLIGGSFARALKKYTGHTVHGMDVDAGVVRAAKQEGAIDTEGDMDECDVVVVCLYPRDTVAYLLGAMFRPGAVVTDICGVKRYIAQCVAQTLRVRGVRYVGSHPMAGKELSGFSASSAELFRGTSYIIVRDEDTDANAVAELKKLAEEIRFARVTMSTTEEHDRVIAYTSQLAHVVSNSYVKNKAAISEYGFSAGSFQDMTRVAKLNPVMWAELFIENKDFLVEDIDELIGNMQKMRNAISAGNEDALRDMLQEGSDIRERL